MTDQQAGQTGTDDGYLLSSLRTAYMDTRQRLEQLCVQAADRIEALTTQLAEDADVRKQIDYRLAELVAQVDALTADNTRDMRCTTEGCGRRVSTRFEGRDYCEPCGRQVAGAAQNGGA